LIKKGFVTPRTTFGLERERERESEEAERGPGRWYKRAGGKEVCLRGLCACGELLEFAVMDSEVGAEIAAELEGLQAAVEMGQQEASEVGAAYSSQDSPGGGGAYLVRASTSSEDMSGEGARTTRGSPRSISSHSICTWVSTGRKHLVWVEQSGRSGRED
jgi:hypothetical protein